MVSFVSQIQKRIAMVCLVSSLKVTSAKNNSLILPQKFALQMLFIAEVYMKIGASTVS